MLNWPFVLSLSVCIVSIVPAFLDHNETLHKIRTCKRSEKSGLWMRFLLLWGIPLLALISTIVSGFVSYDSDRKIAEVEARQESRGITAEQRGKLVGCLREAPKGKVVIAFGMLDGEATAYGEQIENVLTNAGFDAKAPRFPDGASFAAVLTPGAHIVVKDLQNPPVHAIAIQRCFLAAGIRMEGMAAGDSNFDSNSVHVAIGQKK